MHLIILLFASALGTDVRRATAYSVVFPEVERPPRSIARRIYDRLVSTRGSDTNVLPDDHVSVVEPMKVEVLVDQRVVEPLAVAVPVRQISPYDSAMNDQLDQYGRLRSFPSLNTEFGEKFPSWIWPDWDGQTLSNQETELVPVSLGTSLAPVYYIAGHGDKYEVKYNAYCGEQGIDPIDTGVVEAFILERLNGYGITPEFLYFSRALPMQYMSEKFDVSSVGLCPVGMIRGGKQPIVRYLITERLGISLRSALVLHETDITMGEVLRMGIKMVELLERLHSMDIIHGHITLDSFAIPTGLGTESVLELFHQTPWVLVELTRARIVDIEKDFPEGENTRAVIYDSRRTQLVVSPWENKCIVASYRDDVFRVLFLMAGVLHGHKFTSLLDRLNQTKKGNRIVDRLKSFGNFFEFTVPVEDGREIHISLEDVISRSMYHLHGYTFKSVIGDLLSHIRGIRIDEKPNHKLITASLRSLLHLINPT
jgi:hypothetical protein